jgi:hypothetical protein
MPRYEFLCEEWRKPFELIMTREGRCEVPEVPRRQGRAAVRWLHGADGEEELSVLVTNEAEETDAQDPS